MILNLFKLTEDEIALEESISDWKDRKNGVEVARACPLCMLDDSRGGICCQRCVIGRHTGKGCSGTPLYRVTTVFDYHQREIAFLESLRSKKFWIRNIILKLMKAI